MYAEVGPGFEHYYAAEGLAGAEAIDEQLSIVDRYGDTMVNMMGRDMTLKEAFGLCPVDLSNKPLADIDKYGAKILSKNDYELPEEYAHLRPEPQPGKAAAELRQLTASQPDGHKRSAAETAPLRKQPVRPTEPAVTATAKSAETTARAITAVEPVIAAIAVHLATEPKPEPAVVGPNSTLPTEQLPEIPAVQQPEMTATVTGTAEIDLARDIEATVTATAGLAAEERVVAIQEPATDQITAVAYPSIETRLFEDIDRRLSEAVITTAKTADGHQEPDHPYVAPAQTVAVDLEALMPIDTEVSMETPYAYAIDESDATVHTIEAYDTNDTGLDYGYPDSPGARSTDFVATAAEYPDEYPELQRLISYQHFMHTLDMLADTDWPQQNTQFDLLEPLEPLEQAEQFVQLPMQSAAAEDRPLIIEESTTMTETDPPLPVVLRQHLLQAATAERQAAEPLINELMAITETLADLPEGTAETTVQAIEARLEQVCQELCQQLEIAADPEEIRRFVRQLTASHYWLSLEAASDVSSTVYDAMHERKFDATNGGWQPADAQNTLVPSLGGLIIALARTPGQGYNSVLQAA